MDRLATTKKTMRMTKTALSMGIALLAATGLGADALAGSKSILTTSISPTNRSAQGSLGSARNSDNTIDYLECGTMSTGAGYCSGSSASPSAQFFCVIPASNTTLMATMHSLNSDSFLRV